MAYQQPGSSSAPFQLTGAQVPPFTQPSGPNPQYGNPPPAAMLPPQRPFQPNPNALTNAGAAATATSTLPPGQQPGPQPVTSAMTVATYPTTAVQGTPSSDTSGQAQPSTPKTGNLSPEDQERVAALLNLNALLLRELQSLQSTGAAASQAQGSPQQQNVSTPQKHPDTGSEGQKSPTGSVTTPTTTTPTPQTPKLTKPPPKLLYDNFLKRLQVNIAYLLALSGGRPVPPHPGAMEAPADAWFQPSPGEAIVEGGEEKGKETAKQFRDAYQKLRDLWPNYKRVQKPPPQLGGQQQPQQQQQQQQQQQMIGQPSPSGQGQSGQAGPQGQQRVHQDVDAQNKIIAQDATNQAQQPDL